MSNATQEKSANCLRNDPPASGPSALPEPSPQSHCSVPSLLKTLVATLFEFNKDTRMPTITTSIQFGPIDHRQCSKARKRNKRTKLRKEDIRHLWTDDTMDRTDHHKNL